MGCWYAGRAGKGCNGGRANLDPRVIRDVSEPAARFDEACLRLPRAVRIALKLKSVIERATLAATYRLAPMSWW